MLRVPRDESAVTKIPSDESSGNLSFCIPLFSVSYTDIYVPVLLHGNLRSSSDCHKIFDVRNCNHSISLKMCIVWNKLPRDLLQCSSISVF